MADYLPSFPKPFLQDLVQGRCLPFIGAGFSLNAAVPAGKKMLDWDGLGRKAAEALPEYQYTTALEALSAYTHEYSRVKLVEFLSDALLANSIQPSRTHEEFSRLPFERVVTTNFDFLLEQAYARIMKYCIPQVSEDQLSVGNSHAGVQLLKLHGDLHHPNRLVVTEEDYDTFLARLPLLATHLSSLLIGHTALFIGYSLDDPDFRQIWQVVKERLGILRRPAYVLQIGAAPHAVARYERRGVKVINLPKLHSRSYAETLERALRELREYWTSQVIALSTSTEPEPQAELSLPPEAQTRLAFFSVPTRYAALYKAHIYPIAERYGFSPVMAADVVAPGDNLMAKVYALLDRAALVVADVGTQNTVFEVGMVLSREGAEKPLILIAEDLAAVPFDLKGHMVIRRPANLEEDPGVFVKRLEQAFASAFATISPSLEDEPNRLLAKKEYRAAVIAVFSALEHELRQMLETTGVEPFASRASLLMLLDYAKRENVLAVPVFDAIRKHMAVRNRIAHTKGEVTAAVARVIVGDVSKAIAAVREANLARRSNEPAAATT
ncbi:MAG: putative rane protein [Thermoleophilia bacterium]|nr:putative rane protein [Thermoleophilia bacterium]